MYRATMVMLMQIFNWLFLIFMNCLFNFRRSFWVLHLTLTGRSHHQAVSWANLRIFFMTTILIALLRYTKIRYNIVRQQPCGLKGLTRSAFKQRSPLMPFTVFCWPNTRQNSVLICFSFCFSISLSLVWFYFCSSVALPLLMLGALFFV